MAITDEQLKKLNAQAERFERGWYLRGDALEKIRDWADEYPVSVFPEMSKEEWARAAIALEAAGLSLDRISASNMRHVAVQAKKIAVEALSTDV